MNKRRFPVSSMILYVLAGLLFIYAIWGILYCRNYIANAITAGQLTLGGNEYQIVNFYMSTAGIYALYGAIIAGLGCMIQRISSFRKDAGDMEEPVISPVVPRDESSDDDVDDLFDDKDEDKDKV